MRIPPFQFRQKPLLRRKRFLIKCHLNFGRVKWTQIIRNIRESIAQRASTTISFVARSSSASASSSSKLIVVFLCEKIAVFVAFAIVSVKYSVSSIKDRKIPLKIVNGSFHSFAFAGLVGCIVTAMHMHFSFVTFKDSDRESIFGLFISETTNCSPFD